MREPRLLLDTTAAALAKAAAATYLREQVIAANLAHAETPGYQAWRVDFEQALAAALQAAQRSEARPSANQSAAIEDVQPVIRPSAAPPRRWDGNNVNPEEELAALVESALQHQALVRLLAYKLRMLHLAISNRAG
jgi:flagellar basal-body rod protein FlgB